MSPLRGIILAAGKSGRMGTPKSLLEIDGRSLVERHVERLLQAGCSSIAVVTRPETKLALAPEVHVVEASTTEPAESLATAWQHLAGTRGDLVVVTPVDLLPADLATHHALLAAMTGAALAVTPVARGRGGHPVVLHRALLAAYAGPPPYPRLDELLAEAGESRRRVEVADENVLGDLDTPADVAALRDPR